MIINLIKIVTSIPTNIQPLLLAAKTRPGSGVVDKSKITSGSDIIGTIEAPAGIPSKLTDTTPYLRSIIFFLIALAGIFSFWQLITGGLGIITSGGDKAKTEESQKQITNAIVGLVVIAASFIIIAVISQILFDNPGYILNPSIETV